MSRKYYLKLSSTVITPGDFYLIYKMKPVLGFFRLLSAKNTPLDRCLDRKIGALRYQHLGISTTDIKNILVVDFIQKKEAATLFPPSLIDTSTHKTMKQF